MSPSQQTADEDNNTNTNNNNPLEPLGDHNNNQSRDIATPGDHSIHTAQGSANLNYTSGGVVAAGAGSNEGSTAIVNVYDGSFRGGRRDSVLPAMVGSIALTSEEAHTLNELLRRPSFVPPTRPEHNIFDRLGRSCTSPNATGAADDGSSDRQESATPATAGGAAAEPLDDLVDDVIESRFIFSRASFMVNEAALRNLIMNDFIDSLACLFAPSTYLSTDEFFEVSSASSTAAAGENRPVSPFVAPRPQVLRNKGQDYLIKELVNMTELINTELLQVAELGGRFFVLEDNLVEGLELAVDFFKGHSASSSTNNNTTVGCNGLSEEEAALRIQTFQRRRTAQQEVARLKRERIEKDKRDIDEAMKKRQQEEEAAAIKIQSLQRQRAARGELARRRGVRSQQQQQQQQQATQQETTTSSAHDANNQFSMNEDQAATRIQSLQRKRVAQKELDRRRQLKIQRDAAAAASAEEEVKVNAESSAQANTTTTTNNSKSSLSEDDAALKIQSLQRQRAARSEYDRLRSEKTKQDEHIVRELEVEEEIQRGDIDNEESQAFGGVRLVAKMSKPSAVSNWESQKQDDAKDSDDEAALEQAREEESERQGNDSQTVPVVVDANDPTRRSLSRDEAAIKIQCLQRQRMARKEYYRLRAARQAQQEENEKQGNTSETVAVTSDENTGASSSLSQDEAALRIQSLQRQRAAYAEVERRRQLKNESEQQQQQTEKKGDAEEQSYEAMLRASAEAEEQQSRTNNNNNNDEEEIDVTRQTNNKSSLSEEAAAVRIQSLQRQRAARSEYDRLRSEKTKQDEHIVRELEVEEEIQRGDIDNEESQAFGGVRLVAKMSKPSAVSNWESQKQGDAKDSDDEAALEQAREEESARQGNDSQTVPVVVDANDPTCRSLSRDEAAIKIQCLQRQRMARKEYYRLRAARQAQQESARREIELEEQIERHDIDNECSEAAGALRRVMKLSSPISTSNADWEREREKDRHDSDHDQVEQHQQEQPEKKGASEEQSYEAMLRASAEAEEQQTQNNNNNVSANDQEEIDEAHIRAKAQAEAINQDPEHQRQEQARKDEAALRIQSLQRQRAAKQELELLRRERKEREEREARERQQNQAATKIQSIQRQRQARYELSKLRQEDQERSAQREREQQEREEQERIRREEEERTRTLSYEEIQALASQHVKEQEEERRRIQEEAAREREEELRRNDEARLERKRQEAAHRLDQIARQEAAEREARALQTAQAYQDQAESEKSQERQRQEELRRERAELEERRRFKEYQDEKRRQQAIEEAKREEAELARYKKLAKLDELDFDPFAEVHEAKKKRKQEEAERKRKEEEELKQQRLLERLKIQEADAQRRRSLRALEEKTFEEEEQNRPVPPRQLSSALSPRPRRMMNGEVFVGKSLNRAPPPVFSSAPKQQQSSTPSNTTSTTTTTCRSPSNTASPKQSNEGSPLAPLLDQSSNRTIYKSSSKANPHSVASVFSRIVGREIAESPAAMKLQIDGERSAIRMGLYSNSTRQVHDDHNSGSSPVDVFSASTARNILSSNNSGNSSKVPSPPSTSRATRHHHHHSTGGSGLGARKFSVSGKLMLKELQDHQQESRTLNTNHTSTTTGSDSHHHHKNNNNHFLPSIEPKTKGAFSPLSFDADEVFKKEIEKYKSGFDLTHVERERIHRARIQQQRSQESSPTK